LRLRVDRIDRVQTPEGERWLVIDYKTGADADPRGWKAERLTEPQLPLYASHALTGEAGVPRVDGICFAHVKDGHPALVAATNWRERLRDDKPGRFRTDWSGDLARWRALLEQAAQGFLAGEAWIDDSVGERSFNSGLLLLAGHSAGESGEPEAP
jgi:exodeoxyribonuclease-5